MALTDLWGISGRLNARLQAVGITTPRQLRDADPQHMRERFSVVMQRMVMELRGVPCVAFEDVTPDRKSIMASRSFGRPVVTYQDLREAVGTYTSRAAEKMRRQHLATAHVMVFLQTNRFKPADPQYNATRAVRLPVATSDTGRLIKAARDALKLIWKPGYSYKKAGIVLLDLGPAARVQGSLFDQPDTPQRQSLMRALDTLNRDWGRNTVAYASSGQSEPWKLRAERRSPRFTTCWDELLAV